jgi:hypothetical protein
MKRSDLTVFWQLRDNEGFWRVDAQVHRKDAERSDQTYIFDREFEKSTMRGQTMDDIMKRAEGYLQHLIDEGTLDKWYDNAGAAA